MKSLILLFVLIFKSAYAITVKEAFKEFYHDDKISARHCGKNIYHFLNYLKENNVSYQFGYVVSIHEDDLSVPHFDGRWGNKERYQNGESYVLSRWFFHVFAVIDGIAYDFSQKDLKTLPLDQYLKISYIPKSETEMISISGSLNPEKAYVKYLNTKLKIYSLSDYQKRMGPSFYEGSFIELFRIAEKDPIISKSIVNDKVDFKDAQELQNGVWSIIEPYGIYQGQKYPLRAEPVSICRGFGFMGTLSSHLEFKVTDQVDMLKVYSFIPKRDYKRVEEEHFPISFKFLKTDGSLENQALSHYTTKLTCTDLHSILK